MKPVPSAAIILVIEGNGVLVNINHGEHHPFKRGSVFFSEASEKVMIKATGQDNVLLFRAYCDVL